MLGRFLLMAQAAFLDRQFFDLLPPFNDGRVTPEVDIGGRNVAKALVVAMVVVMLDEGPDLVFEIAGQVIVLEENPVLEGLMLPLDFTLRLRVVRGSSNVIHAVILEPGCEVTEDVGRAVVAEQTGFVNDLGAATT